MFQEFSSTKNFDKFHSVCDMMEGAPRESAQRTEPSPFVYKDFNKLEKKMVGGMEVLLTR